MKRKKVPLTLVPTILILVTITLGTAVATDGNLPGGTSISVEFTAPPDGALVAYPPGDITLEGTASIGEGVPVPNTLIVYVLDVSYSTIRGDGGAGCGGDQNGDGASDTILDCEILATKTLNGIVAGLGTVGEVGVAVLGAGGAAADVNPDLLVDELLTGPDTDAGGDPGSDVEEVLSSAFSQSGGPGGVSKFTYRNVGSGATNFAAGLSAAVSIVNESGKPNRQIVYLADGLGNTGAHVSTVSVPSDVDIYTFAVGTIADCDAASPLYGNLAEIAAMGSGDGFCTEVGNVPDLPSEVVPPIIASELYGLELQVDGGSWVDLSGVTVPPLPLTGPASTSFTYPVPGLMPGIHEFCAKATGSDGGGEDDVTDCIEATVADIDLEPDEATNELGYPGQTHTVTGTVAAGADGGVANVTVDFEIVSGPNMGQAGADVTDANGEATFTYVAMQGLAGLGTDVIEGCFEDDLGVEVCDSVEKHWVDTTPPEVECTETVNPAGKNVPKSKNPDGFYELTAVDLVDPDPQIWVIDSGTGVEFGPFASGTKIKYTQAPGVKPTMRKIGSVRGKAGAIDWHIFGQGDACVKAVDASGNWSDCVDCLVPPPPK